MTWHEDIAMVGIRYKSLRKLFLPIAAIIISVVSLTMTIVLDAESRACSFMHMTYNRLTVLAEGVYIGKLEAKDALLVLTGKYTGNEKEWKSDREAVDAFFVTLMAHVESTRVELQLHRVSIPEKEFDELAERADDADTAYNTWRLSYRSKSDTHQVADSTLERISDYMDSLDEKTESALDATARRIRERCQ